MAASFEYQGHSIAYSEHGSGDRLLVLTHGLLMNRRMFDRLEPEMAAHGNRVVCIDLLGHGESDRPRGPGHYSIPAFSDQLLGLLDHLDAPTAIVGGTSLGANVALQLAVRHPQRAKGLFIEMPVLEHALVAATVIFTPILVGAQIGAPVLRWLSAVTRRVPRTTLLADIWLDWMRREPEVSADVMRGLMLGPSAPLSEERRRLHQPALVIGHRADPLHQLSDADMLVDEMANARRIDANSILEWRVNPKRLNDELATFLDEVWADAALSTDAAAAAAAG